MRTDSPESLRLGLILTLLMMCPAVFAAEEGIAKPSGETGDKPPAAQPIVEPPASPATDSAAPAEETAVGERVRGEITGLAVVMKRMVGEEEDKTVVIIGRVTCEDEAKLSKKTLAELKRIGRKRLRVTGPKTADVERMNGKLVVAKGVVDMASMTMEVESVTEHRPPHRPEPATRAVPAPSAPPTPEKTTEE